MRLIKRWGIQPEHVLTGEWVNPLWFTSREAAEQALTTYRRDGVPGTTRLVSQVVGPLTIEDEGKQPPTCPKCGGLASTSGGRHPLRCIRADCRTPVTER